MKKEMTQTLLILLIIIIGIGTYYAFKYGKFIREKENHLIVPEFVVLKYFGKINLNQTEEYTSVLANINDNEIGLDLNFVEESVSKQSIEPTLKFLNKLSEIEKIAQKQILSDFNTQNVVNEYIEHHLQEFKKDELKILGILPTDTFKEKKFKFLKKIQLKRIGIYPEEPDSLATFDFTIGEELTQYLIVLRFDSNGNCVEIVIES